MSSRARSSFPKIAVVTPLYNESEALPRYFREVGELLLDNSGCDVRLILVDDGSQDRSWQMLREACGKDERVSALRLSRNFGSHAAIAAGLNAVPDDIDAVVVMACDLQDPPAVALEFVEQWRQGADIVWGQRTGRRDARWRIAASTVFEAMLRRWALPRGSLFTTGSFFLADRRVVEAMRAMQEHNRITFALVAWTGFDQARVPYQRAERVSGRSKWGVRRMLKTMYDAFVGFSTLPIRLMKAAATAAFLLALGLVAYLLVIAAVTRTSVPGWTSQMLVLSVFFGIQFSLTAMIGEYLARIYQESVARPAYFVSELADIGTEPERVGRGP